MEIRKLDRSNGADCGTMHVEQAANVLAEWFDGDRNEIRKQLLAGVPFRTVAYHYEITPESLAAYRAAKLEAEYDRIAMKE